MSMKRIAVAALIGTGMSVAGAALALAQGTTPATTTPAPVVTTHAVTARAAVVAPTTPARCTVKAPSTAKGYATMFAAVNPAQWGAADVSISVPLADGRSVWLYGDTLSTGRFVHSTAITQDKGCLHVSRAGAQLLPNDDARHIYWIDSAKISAGRLLVTAQAITITDPSNPWGFKYAGHMRTALVTVSLTGDATFVRWVSDVHTAAPDAGPMYVYGPHHIGYARHTHPEAHLASGRVLVTTCQNWDDGIVHPFAAYRPIFSER